MNSTTKITNNSPLVERLSAIGLRATAANFNDLIARAGKQRWSAVQLLEEIANRETTEKASRNLAHRMMLARLGRFKSMADFDWNWPKKIDRGLIESALTADFVKDGMNFVLLGSNGLGKR